MAYIDGLTIRRPVRPATIRVDKSLKGRPKKGATKNGGGEQNSTGMGGRKTHA